LVDDIKVWAKNNELPHNIQATLIQRQREDIKKAEADEAMKLHFIDWDEETQTQKISREYKINL
jgi:hypothetical protein